MAIDWEKPAESGSLARAAAILRASDAGGPGGESKEGGLEGMAEGPGSAASPEDRLAKLGDALARTAGPLPGMSRQDVANKVLAGARSGLAKLDAGEPAAAFTLGEHVGLESVIITTGERPSLVVREGFVDLTAPDVGSWDFNLTLFQAAIRKVIAAVGRVDVPVKPWYAGTCFVLAPGLVVTNRHVLEAIATQHDGGAWTLSWPDQTTVNFNGEDGATGGSRFKVVDVAFAGPDPIRNTIDFTHLDMAVLRVDPDSDKMSPFPAAVTLATEVEQPKVRSNLCVLGFPGQPRVWMFDGTPPAGTETMQVISDLFSAKFGVKRLAPGLVKAGPGDVANDTNGWICTHDASTLLGNSGSCVVDLDSDGARVVALHFAGANRAQNWAHVASRLHDVLGGFAATFVG